jgi:hypothetical protein
MEKYLAIFKYKRGGNKNRFSIQKITLKEKTESHLHVLFYNKHALCDTYQEALDAMLEYLQTQYSKFDNEISILKIKQQDMLKQIEHFKNIKPIK